MNDTKDEHGGDFARCLAAEGGRQWQALIEKGVIKGPQRDTDIRVQVLVKTDG